MPNLTQMRSFHAVYLHGSTVRAAELTGRSQSQISADLRAFEAAMGLSLFSRSNGRLSPTGHAEQVFARVVQVFAAYDEVMALARERGGNSLNIGATRSLSMTVLPTLVRELRRRDPLAAVSVHFMSYRDLVAAVAEQRLDQAIVKLPVDDPRVQCVDLGAAPLVVVMRPDDRLARLERIVPHDIGTRSIVRTGSASPAWLAVQRAFADSALQPNSDVSMDGVGPVCRMVADGEGLAIVNRMLAAGYVQDLGLEMRLFEPLKFETFTLIGPAAPGRRAKLHDIAGIIRSLVALYDLTHAE